MFAQFAGGSIRAVALPHLRRIVARFALLRSENLPHVADRGPMRVGRHPSGSARGGTMFRPGERPQGMSPITTAPSSDQPSGLTPAGDPARSRPPGPGVTAPDEHGPRVSTGAPRRAAPRPTRRCGRGLVVALALAVALGGCGGSDSDESDDDGGDATTVVDTESDSSGDTESDGDSSDDTGSGDTSDTGDSEPAGPTAELPDDFPAELTPPDDAVYRNALANEQDGKKDWLVQASIPGEVDAVADAVVSQLEEAGYTITSDEEGGIPGGERSRLIQAEDDTYIFSLSLDSADVVGGVEGSTNAAYTVTEK